MIKKIKLHHIYTLFTKPLISYWRPSTLERLHGNAFAWPALCETIHRSPAHLWIPVTKGQCEVWHFFRSHHEFSNAFSSMNVTLYCFKFHYVFKYLIDNNWRSIRREAIAGIIVGQYVMVLVIQIKYGLPYCVTCPSMSTDPGSLNPGMRRSRIPGWWDPGIRTNTGAGDTVLAKHT